jgi:lipid II:glycine glycyltransferase (peptidoglycan interpeptide bridge formation enzyme)
MDQNAPHWNQILQQFPQPSFLQTWEWGQVKARYGWEVDTKIWQDEKGTVQAAALILIREQKLPVIGKKLRIMYVPKGPLLKNWHEPLRKKVLDDLRVYAQKAGAVYIKIDPEIITARGFEGNPDYEPDKSGCEIVQQLQQDGWRKTDQQIQFKNTFWIDLKSSKKTCWRG